MGRASLVELPGAITRPTPSAGARYVMGMDGGATKTLAAVLDLEALDIHVAHAGPSNEDAIGVRAAVQVLLEVADEALARAGIPQSQLARAVLAIAGTDTQSLARHLRAERSEDWIVVNDVVAAWAAATSASAGVGVIAGTGSNVFGVGPHGRAWRAGGWGHLLGDEGSGYWLGVHSISAALRDRDASGPPTALSTAAVEFFGVERVEDLAPLVYAKPLTKGEIAAFATVTQRVAQQGDEVARALYAQGARELGHQIAVVIRESGLAEDPATEFPVGLIGGAFRAGSVFVDPLTAAVAASAPHARVATVELQPVGGSLLLAAHACGHTLERAAFEQRLDAVVAAPPRRPGSSS